MLLYDLPQDVRIVDDHAGPLEISLVIVGELPPDRLEKRRVGRLQNRFVSDVVYAEMSKHAVLEQERSVGLMPFGGGQDEILTAKEAADFLKISTLTLRKKIRDDSLPAHRMGRKWILIKSEVLEWLRKQ